MTANTETAVAEIKQSESEEKLKSVPQMSRVSFRVNNTNKPLPKSSSNNVSINQASYIDFSFNNRFDSVDFIDKSFDGKISATEEDEDNDVYEDAIDDSTAAVVASNAIEIDEIKTSQSSQGERDRIIIELDAITSTKNSNKEESIQMEVPKNGTIRLAERIANMIKQQSVMKENASSTEHTLLSSVENKSYSSNGNCDNNIKVKDTKRTSKAKAQQYSVVLSNYLQKSNIFSSISNRFSRGKNYQFITTIKNKSSDKPVGNSKLTQYVCKESEAQRRSLIVLIAFILGYTPLFTLITISWVTNLELNSNYFVILTWLGYLSSALNPSLYAWMNRNLKKAFYLIITCKINSKLSRHNTLFKT